MAGDATAMGDAIGLSVKKTAAASKKVLGYYYW